MLAVAAVGAIGWGVSALSVVAIVVFSAYTGIPGYRYAPVFLNKLQYLFRGKVQLWDFNIHESSIALDARG